MDFVVHAAGTALFLSMGAVALCGLEGALATLTRVLGQERRVPEPGQNGSTLAKR